MAIVVAAVLGGTLLTPVAAHADVAPTVVIANVPATNPPVSNPVPVTVDVTSDPATANGSDVTLYLDDPGLNPSSFVSTAACPSSSCSGLVLPWDTTGLTGDHTLYVQTTARSSQPTSAVASQTVTVVSPVPTATLSVPATVTLTQPVSLTGTTDPGQLDYPTSVDLQVDGTVVATLPCTTTSSTCTGPVSWDTTGYGPTASLVPIVKTHRGLTQPGPATKVTVSNPAATVVITSPVASSNVSGTVVVDVTASTDPGLSDFPTQLDLYADGSPTPVDTRVCTSGVHDCSQPLSWDATGLTGSHTLVAKLTTSKPAAVTPSQVVSLNVVPPRDPVSVISPKRGAIVVGVGATNVSSGLVEVNVSGSTATTRRDFPSTFELLVNAKVVDTKPCPVGVHDCTLVLRWDARRYAGAYDVAARMTTTRRVASTSPTVSVFARSGSQTTTVRFALSSYLGVVTLRGRVMALNTKLGAAGVTVRVVRVPAVGKKVVTYVRTRINGTFALQFRVATTTTVTANVGAGWIGPSRSAQTQYVRAPMACSAVSSVRLGATGTGRCSVRLLPAGTAVSLRYFFGGRWSTLASGRTRTTAAIPFSFRFPRRGTYQVRVIVGKSRVYAATASRLMKVVVR